MDHEYGIQGVGSRNLEDFWQLRLRSLHEHPEAYGSDYEASRRAGPTYGERGYFSGGINRLFAAYTHDGDLVAQAGVYQDSGKRSHIAHIISVYTHPDHRGRGLATKLVQACITHVQSFPEITSIRISVNANNTGALRIYEHLGFETWGEEPDAIRTPDGSCHNERHMVLTSGARRS